MNVTGSSDGQQQSNPTTLGLDQWSSYEILEGAVDFD